MTRGNLSLDSLWGETTMAKESTLLDWTLPEDKVWRARIEAFLASPEGKALREAIDKEEKHACVFPQAIFRAMKLTPFHAVKVVILGQDPYHGDNQAEGLAFSVAPGVKVPPSLRNIKKEIAAEWGMPVKTDGSLVAWAQEGVLLLNATLTVRAYEPNSHKDLGWQKLTDGLIEALSQERDGLVFMLWGNFARAKRDLIDPEKHCILEANHPSPLSANKGPIPFLGCGHFKQANAWLVAHGKEPIDWLK